MLRIWKARAPQLDKAAHKAWWKQIDDWREKKSLSYKTSRDVIMPQYAVERLYALTKDRDTYITTEVGQHQMWAAQFYHFEEPNRWMTSGGLGTMGYGLPAAIGAQLAHPKSLVIDIAGDASILMNIQECSTAVQFDLPVKVFILNNQYMGMVRQWQQLLHGNRLSHSYTDSLPDFVKLAEAYGWTGMRCDNPADLDEAIQEMIDTKGPVIFDCRVAALANCFPMIPSGKAHNEMLLGEDVCDEEVEQRDQRRRQGAGVMIGIRIMQTLHGSAHGMPATRAHRVALALAAAGVIGMSTTSLAAAQDPARGIRSPTSRMRRADRADAADARGVEGASNSSMPATARTACRRTTPRRSRRASRRTISRRRCWR